MTFVVWLTALLSIAIALRLIAYNPHAGAQRRPAMAVVAWLAAAACMHVVVRIVTGQLAEIDPGLFVLVLVFAVGIFIAGGNVARLFDTRPRQADHRHAATR
jgi:hypothetical protein